jgi:hypothetical protein
MILIEKKQNIFDLDKKKYYFAHCIAADCGMGAGIAVEFNKKFHLKKTLLTYGEMLKSFPATFLHNRVFNLITKAKSSGKPTYQSIEDTIKQMRKLCEIHKVEYLAIPKIGCGLDKLSWPIVKEMIVKAFEDTDIEILVCHL